MATATQITITLTDNTVVTLPINNPNANDTSQSAAQRTISSVVKLNGFWSADGSTWHPVSQIKSITYS